MGKKRKKDRRLPNERQELFCSLFVFGNPKHDPDDELSPPDPRRNATISYMQAGYKAGYDAARVNASRLLTKANIQVRIGELRTEEQRIKTAFLSHWKTMLPDAQDVLRRAMDGEEVSPAQISAAKEVIEQAVGPSRFRFGIDKGADKDGGLQITVWSGKKE